MAWHTTTWNWIKDTAGAAMDAVWPRQCAVCGTTLGGAERHLCRKCMMDLPRTGLHLVPFNAMEQLFAGRVPIERAAAYFYYRKGDPYAAILHDAKYHDVPTIGRYMAAHAAREMQASGLFADVDLIVPVPLHRDKLAERGYNQSEYIARGLADVTGIAVSNALVATRAHSTQTHKGAADRYSNTRGAYGVRAGYETMLTGRHVMIVDDVVTTGATLLVCAQAIHALPGTRITLFTLAAARLS